MSRFTIADDHPALPGHFPGRPVVPGVVILDRVLDAVEAAHGPLRALRLPQVKFTAPLLPGQEARIVLDPLACEPQAPPTRWRFRVERDGQLLANGEVAAA